MDKSTRRAQRLRVIVPELSATADTGNFTRTETEIRPPADQRAGRNGQESESESDPLLKVTQHRFPVGVPATQNIVAGFGGFGLV